MSNHIGFFNGTGAVSNQPKESKIKTVVSNNKEIEYFKVVMYCENAFHNDNGSVTEKRIDTERVIGVEKDFNWLPLQNYLGTHCKNAQKALNSCYNIKCESRWYRVPEKKTRDAVILDKNNIHEQMNGLVGDFCHKFNRSMASTKKIHTKPFHLEDFVKDETPTL